MALPALQIDVSADQAEQRVAGGAGYEFAKRAIDLSLGAIALLAALPLCLIVALLIRVTSPGPILFRQTRCGRHGRPFTCLKFRTMRIDADALLAGDEALAAAFARDWKLAEDPRVTRVGRFLRRLSLDELPQFINVIRGEMSLVGPRPVQPRELEDCFGEFAAVVTRVRPGLTCLWAVSGRSLVGYPERVALEVEYVRRRSLLLDLRVMLLTVPTVLSGRGAV